MAPGFKVDPPVLESFAGTSDDRRAAYDALRQKMHDLRVNRDAFGHIPFLGSSIYDSYDEHVDTCEEAVTSAATAMAAIAAGIRSVVIAYLDGEAKAGEDLAAIHRSLDGVDIQATK